MKHYCESPQRVCKLSSLSLGEEEAGNYNVDQAIYIAV